MRLATWNLNHRAARRRIPDWVSTALGREQPDVVVLTEYVVGDDHVRFCEALEHFGLSCVSVSPKVPRQNQILLASREPHTVCEVDVPHIHPSLAPNLLQVVLERTGVTVLGFRMPAYSGPEARLKRPTWEWLLDYVANLASTPTVLTGDLNTAIGDTPTRCGDCFDTLPSLGWAVDTPLQGVSWRHPRTGSGRAIDHLLSTSHVRVDSVSYSWDFEDLRGSAPVVVGSPDHAMLLATLAAVRV